MDFFITQLRFPQNLRLKFKLHKLFDAPALHQHLWSLFINRHAQLVLLREENCPLLRHELESRVLEQSAKLPYLLLRKWMSVRIHEPQINTVDTSIRTRSAVERQNPC